MINGSIVITASFAASEAEQSTAAALTAYEDAGYSVNIHKSLFKAEDTFRKVTFDIYEPGVDDLDLEIAVDTFHGWPDGTTVNSLPGASTYSTYTAYELSQRQTDNFFLTNGVLSRNL